LELLDSTKTTGLSAYDYTPESLAYLNGKLKRFVDISGALLGIVIGFPVFALSSLIVKLVDKVPVLFSQERVGLHGIPFTIFKLRTLKTVDARDLVNLENMYKKPDYQTTSTGKFWRVTSIDEIVQFWLVLKGDMSLIGHRPFPVYYLPHLPQLDGMDQAKADHYLGIIYQYKPGMSSLSAVNGRGNLTMQQKFGYDLLYAREACFWLDIILLFKTLFVVITREGAK